MIFSIAVFAIFLIPYPLFDLIIGGFAGALVTSRLKLVTILTGYLGAVATIALNFVSIAIRSGGGAYGAKVSLIALLSAFIFYGGLGVLFGIIFHLSLSKPKQESGDVTQ